MPPKVSVIIPVYNVEAYLPKCLESVLGQSFNNIEIIAVNDGSSDSSLSIIQKYASNDDRLNVINQPNGGLSAARNSGIKAAKGDFLSFIDSDDYIEKDMLQKMYDLAMKYDYDIVICRYRQIDEYGKTHYKSGITKGFSKEDHFRRVLSGQSSSMACDKIYRRNLFINNNIAYPLGLYHEDVPTTFKLFFYANKIGVVEEYFYNWLRRSGSISKCINKKHIEDTYAILLLTREFLMKLGLIECYNKELTRRYYHFFIGLVDRIYMVTDPDINSNELFRHVLKYAQNSGLYTPESLRLLQETDTKLYNKVICFEHIADLNVIIDDKYDDNKCLKELVKVTMELNKIKNSEVYRVVNKINDISVKLLPYNSKRRSLIKKIIQLFLPTKAAKIANAEQTIMLTAQDKKSLQNLHNKFSGKRCFILGNGPSLNKCDLTLLKDEFSFGVNGIFYKIEEMGFKPTFFMVEDGHVIDDNLDKINEYAIDYKFFPTMYKDKINKKPNTYFFEADLGFYKGDHSSYCRPRFSKDFSTVAYCGQSVTYLNMQLAYYMGFSDVYLIGMDFSYDIPDSAEVKGATLISKEDDPNHFHPDYFGKGKKWHDPKVDRVGWNYEFAKKTFEEDNRKIYNATIGGKLEIFDRVDFANLFKETGES